jgi:hypothetical protein
MKNFLVLPILSSLILFSCGKGGDGDEPAPARASVEIENLAQDGCLNVPAYFDGIRGMDPNLTVFELSTDFEIGSRSSVRREFRQLMAYATFRLGSKPLRQFYEFQSLSQDSCETLTFLAADGTEDVFEVKSASRESLYAVHEDGRSLHYVWLGPQRMKIDLRYHAYDLPCGRPDPVLLRHGRILDWSGVSPSLIGEDDSPFRIEREYLALVADAVGQRTEDLYEPGPSGIPLVSAAKVREMITQPPRDGVLACSGSAPEPSPSTPEPYPGPEDPGPAEGTEREELENGPPELDEPAESDPTADPDEPGELSS